MKSFLYSLVESAAIVWGVLKANKNRAVLTTLGVVIGIMAVATTMTVSNGLGNQFKEDISAVGSDVLYVSRIPWIITGDFFQFRSRPQITFEQCEKLAAQFKMPVIVTPSTGTRRNLKYESNILERINIIGTTEKQILVSNAVPDYGRFISGIDVHYKKFICVIGSEIKEHLFPNVDALHKEIKVGRYTFRVVGVMEKMGGGTFGGPNYDRRVYIPITSFIRAYGSRNRQFTIAVKAPSQDVLEEFRYSLIGEMRQIRKLSPTEEDDFTINSMDSLMSAYNNVMGVVVVIGFIITSFSLFVGGIGLMNVMFVSVTERTREIGIRMAIGAKRKTILFEFLLEASCISLLGGLIGLVLSYGIALLIDKLLMPAAVSLPIVVIAIFVSFLIGVFSGLIPALRASRLHPIDALRYE
ncbi:ABC transporter permease [bacterium]|nr:ABC transporter permease [bacterium]